jgi:hypothetical protein
MRVGVVETAERFLHYARRHVRRSKREEKASARFGRNDSKLSRVSQKDS